MSYNTWKLEDIRYLKLGIFFPLLPNFILDMFFKIALNDFGIKFHDKIKNVSVSNDDCLLNQKMVNQYENLKPQNNYN